MMRNPTARHQDLKHLSFPHSFFLQWYSLCQFTLYIYFYCDPIENEITIYYENEVVAERWSYKRELSFSRLIVVPLFFKYLESNRRWQCTNQMNPSWAILHIFIHSVQHLFIFKTNQQRIWKFKTNDKPIEKMKKDKI